MRKFFPFAIIIVVVASFFYQTLFFGNIPFPGDLLIAEYQPWKSYSFEGYNPGSYPHKAQYFDVIRQLYPWKAFAVEEIQQGRFPLWNPYNFSGSPLFANLQSAVLYPTILLFLALPMVSAWTISIILQPLLAAIFTYLYAKKIDLSPAGAVFAAITFSGCLYMSVFIQYNTIGHVIVWLPCIFWCIESYLQNKHSKILVLLALSTAMSLFAGHLQLFASVLLCAVLYILYRVRTTKSTKKSLLLLITSLILGLGISAVQLVPTMELIQYSARVPHERADLINRLLIQPKQLFMLLIPDLFGNPATRNYSLTDSYPGKAMYIGVLPFIFALWSLVTLRNQQSPQLKFFVLLGLLVTFFLVRHPITDLVYSIPLPLISTSSPTNLLFLLSFSLAILAGFGFQEWLTRKQIPWIIVIFLILSGVILLLLSNTLEIIRSQIIVFLLLLAAGTSLLLIHRYTPLPKLFLIAGCIILTCADLGYFFLKFNPFVPSTLVYPSVPVSTALSNGNNFDRTWGYGAANIEANFDTALRIYSPEGYDPLYPKWYGELVSFSANGSIINEFNRQSRSDAKIAQGSGPEMFPHPSRRQLLRLLGVSHYLIHTQDRLTERELPPTEFIRKAAAEPLTVYADTTALPRAFLTDNIRNIPAVSLSSGSATVSLYHPHRVQITVDSPNSTYLVLSDTYFPGWRARINNEPTQILNAFHALRAVAVPKGNSTVEFTYEPASIRLGGLISLGSIVAMVLGHLFIRKKYLI